MHKYFSSQGKKLFSLGGQAHNSSTFNSEDFEVACQAVSAVGGNTVAFPISWEAFEPREGEFDVDLVQSVIQRVREHGLHLIILWFATWKNGTMEYTPAWVKNDPTRFPRVKCFTGEPTFHLSSHCAANRDADAAAFTQLMAAVRDFDQIEQTVIGVQIENEAGIYGPTTRDFGAEAERDFTAALPGDLLEYAREHPESKLGQKVAAARRAGETDGALSPAQSLTWTGVFGPDAATSCTAWSIAKYIDDVAARGRAMYDIPFSVNAWVDGGNWGVGGLDYPSGGPVNFNANLDIWRATLKNVDFISPDVYVSDQDSYRSTMDDFALVQDALFVPESGARNPNTSLMFYAVGNPKSIGFHVFAIEELLDESGELNEVGEAFERSFGIVNSILPVLEESDQVLYTQSFVQYPGQRLQRFQPGDWLGYVTYEGPGFEWNAMDFRHLIEIEAESDPYIDLTKEGARGFIVQTGPNEFYMSGHKMRVFLTRKLKDSGEIPFSIMNSTLQTSAFPTVSVEEGKLVDGRFVVDRVRTGDESRHGVWLQGDCGLVRVRLTNQGY